MSWFVVAESSGLHALQVTVQFDNTLDRVKNNIKTVNKYMAEKLCKVPAAQVMALEGKDESSLLNHQSKVSQWLPWPRTWPACRRQSDMR